MKKIISLLIALALTISLVPYAFASEGGFAINGATVKVLSNKDTEIRRNGKIVATIPASIPLNYTGCSNYVSQLIRTIWEIPNGTNINYFFSDYNMLKYKRNPKDREVTVEHVREFIQDAPLGSSIRVNADGNLGPNPDCDNCWGHSMLLVAKDNEKGTFTVLEGGGGVWVSKFTYKSFVDRFTKSGSNQYYPYFFRIANLTSFGTGGEEDPAPAPANITLAHPNDLLYTLTPACAPNSALDVANKRTDNEANLHIWQRYDPLTSPNQQWQLERVDGDYYTIKNENSGRVASIEHNYSSSESTVWQYGYGASNAQKWRFEDAGDGYYYIVPKQNTDLCLDVSGASGENGTNVQVYTKNYTDAQKWKLVPVEKPVPTYTVHFDANGGKVSPTSKTVTEGDFIGTMPEPSRKGYEFQFWGSERDGTCMVVTSNNLYIFEDTTLYAHWKEVEPIPTPEPEWKEGWDKLKDALTGKNDKSEEEPPVTSSPEPEQKVESTLDIEEVKAVITKDNLTYYWKVSSNYLLKDYSYEWRNSAGSIVDLYSSYYKGEFYNHETTVSCARFPSGWKKDTYTLTIQVKDASGKEASASTTVELPFDIDGEGRPVKK